MPAHGELEVVTGGVTPDGGHLLLDVEGVRGASLRDITSSGGASVGVSREAGDAGTRMDASVCGNRAIPEPGRAQRRHT